MLKVLSEACTQLANYSDFWLLGALGDWSFEEGDRNTSFCRYLDTWHDPDLPVPQQFLCDMRLGINGLLDQIIRPQPGVESSERNRSRGHDIVFRAGGQCFSTEVKYVFDCTYDKWYRQAIPADRDKHPDYLVVFFVSLPNYYYLPGRYFGKYYRARQTNFVGLSTQYSQVCRFLGQAASWPTGSAPYCVALPQGTDVVTDDRVRAGLPAFTKHRGRGSSAQPPT